MQVVYMHLKQDKHQVLHTEQGAEVCDATMLDGGG